MISRCRWMSLLVGVIISVTARGGETWQRISCIDDLRLKVSLLLKGIASPADEEFVGFEFNNLTQPTLPLRVSTEYRLDEIRAKPRTGTGPWQQLNMAQGNGDKLIPTGISREARHSSAYSFALLSSVPESGWLIEGRAHLRVKLADGTSLSTPAEGVPFGFEWLPADAAGIVALRSRLLRILDTPTDPFGDACLIETLLKDPRIASAASLEILLSALKRHESSGAPGSILNYININHATDDQTVAFFVAVIRARNQLLLQQLDGADHIHDQRLIEPLLEWMREDRPGARVPHAVLELLKHHRDLMKDRRAVSAELGRIIWPNLFTLTSQKMPTNRFQMDYLAIHLNTLALTGDETMVDRLRPYLGFKELLSDARHRSESGTKISLRVCDIAYNTIWELLDRPYQQISFHGIQDSTGVGWRPASQSSDEEFARRDVLIESLKAQLTARPADPQNPK